MKASNILFLTLLTLATSTQIDNNVQRRQVDLPAASLGTGGDSSSSPTAAGSSDSTTPTSTPTDTPTSTPTDTPTSTPTDTPTSTPPSSTEPPTSKTSETSSQDTTTTPTSTSATTSQTTSPTSTKPTSTSSTPTSTSPTSSPTKTSKTSTQKTTAAPVTTARSTITHVITENGSTRTSLSTSSAVVTPTDSASLAGGGDSKSSGMSSKTRNTIIGVVVGVGGAILLGALAIVAHRVWGKRRNHAPEDDGLMYNGYNGGSSHGDKDSSMAPTNTTPFQSTLESYHNPAHGANVSSNF